MTQPIRAFLNSLDGVRVFRNNSGALPLGEGGFLRYGLGEGSSDLVGIVRLYSDSYLGQEMGIGRFFALEIKRSGKKPDADQGRWLATVRSLGGFACVIYGRNSQEACDDAHAAVDRCRAGASE